MTQTPDNAPQWHPAFCSLDPAVWTEPPDRQDPPQASSDPAVGHERRQGDGQV